MRSEHRTDHERENALGGGEIAAPSAKAGVQALDNLLHAGGSPPVVQVVSIIETYPADRDAILTKLHQTLGNRFVQEVVVGHSTKSAGDDRSLIRESAPAMNLEDDEKGSACRESIEDTALAGFSGFPEEIPYRTEMERSFGQSFVDIKGFRGPEARSAALALGARAYVLGDKIAFADDNPSKEVVAHELTHVVQDRGGASQHVRGKSEVSASGDAHEQEANRVATLVASGEPSGQISEPAASAVSRLDVWDVLNVGTGGAVAERELTKNSPAQQTLEDLVASMVAGVKFMPEEFKALFPDKEDIAGWWRFIQVTEGLVAAEVGVLILTGVPDPTFTTKLAALVLQALIVTFMIVMSVQLGGDAIQTAQKWWSKVTDAHGDPAKIDGAAKDFAHLVGDLIQLIGTLADITRASRTLGKLHGTETRPRAKPTANLDEKGVVPAKPSSEVRDHESESQPAGKAKVEESQKLSSGSKHGIDPTAESIRQGTVRMEEHPDFDARVAELKAKGYQFKYVESGDPHVQVREVVTPQGEVIRTEKAVFVVKGMRFLDLEHELGHVEQLESLKDAPATDRVLETGREYSGAPKPGYVTTARDTILEFHNRLREYFRLKERGVPSDVLKEHASGVRDAQELYRRKGIRDGRNKSDIEWSSGEFPDLLELQARFKTEEGS